MDRITLPNGVAITFAKSDAPFDPDHAEIEHWVGAVRMRGLHLSSVPDEYRDRVHARLCEVLVADLDVPQPPSEKPPANWLAKE